MEVTGMEKFLSPRGPALLKALAAAILGIGALSGFAIATNVWASEPQQKPQHSAVRPPVSDAQVAARTAPLADLEQAFEAINERIQPSVVSISVNKTVHTASMQQEMPDMDDLFRGFPGIGGGGQGRTFRSAP